MKENELSFNLESMLNNSSHKFQGTLEAVFKPTAFLLSLYFPLVKLSMFMFPFNNDHQNDIQALKLSKMIH